jgi:hypothetical protein
MRARRAALRDMSFPLPSSLWSFGGGATTAASAGLLAKGAAVLAVGALAAGVGTRALDRARPHEHAAALPTVPADVTTARLTVRNAPVRHRRTAVATRVRSTAEPKRSPHAAARPQPAAQAPSSTTATTTTAAQAPTQAVVATVAAPALPAVEIDWHRLALLGRGPVIEVPALVGTLPAPPAIAAAVEAATPPATLPPTVTVTIPQVTTVTVPIPLGP